MPMKSLQTDQDHHQGFRVSKAMNMELRLIAAKRAVPVSTVLRDMVTAGIAQELLANA